MPSFHAEEEEEEGEEESRLLEGSCSLSRAALVAERRCFVRCWGLFGRKEEEEKNLLVFEV